MSVSPLNFPISVIGIIVFTVSQIRNLGIILDFLPSYDLPLQMPHYPWASQVVKNWAAQW